MQPDNAEGSTSTGRSGTLITPTIDAEEVAGLFGLKRNTFLRKRREMVAAGFPEPLPVPGASPVWSRRLVDLWIASNGRAAPVDLGDPVAAQRAALETRLGEEVAA